MKKRGRRVGDWALALMGGQDRVEWERRVFPLPMLIAFFVPLFCLAGTGLPWASPALSGANEKGLNVQ